MASGAPVSLAVRHRVLLVLVLVALPAVWMGAFVSIAPNRLVSGSGAPLAALALLSEA